MATSERETLQELIVEAHQAIKDLRGLLREVGQATSLMMQLVQREQREVLEEAALPVINKFVEEFEEHIRAIDEMVDKRYENVLNFVLERLDETPRLGESSADAVLRIIQEKGYEL